MLSDRNHKLNKKCAVKKLTATAIATYMPARYIKLNKLAQYSSIVTALGVAKAFWIIS